MWELVKESTLDQNSAYKYILMCDFFKESCIVAKEGGKVVGFVTGFSPPNKPQTIFVWQIGVKAEQRGKGLAKRMLLDLVNGHSAKISYVEATVTPTNEASQALFKSLAKSFHTDCKIEDYYSEQLFPGDQHEKELMFKIGPIG